MDVSLIIKTFKRRKALQRLLKSIRDKGYEDLPVLIADDSKFSFRETIYKKYEDIVDEYIKLPFDSGISKGRNELIKRVETEYFVLNDDDFVYGEETKIREAIDRIEKTSSDILCGYYIDKNPKTEYGLIPNKIYDFFRNQSDEWQKHRWVANIHETEDNGIIIDPISSPSPIQECDIGNNFFVARTDKIKNSVGGWNESLKTQEHWDFFYRCKKSGLSVLSYDEFGVYHIRESPDNYDEYRFSREEEMIMKSLRENNFDYLIRGDEKFVLHENK